MTHLEKFISTRKQTVDICKNLCLEDFVIQPCPEVSPPKWHLGHTTWFFEEFITSKYTKRFNEKYGVLFNSYYKSMGEHWIQGNRGQLSRPTVEEVFEYRSHVDKSLMELKGDLDYLVEVGINHEQQHQELLYMDIKYILGVNPLFPKYFKEESRPAERPSGGWLSFKEGLYDIGYGGKGFHYDNEGPLHKKYLYPFEIAQGVVSNGEYLEFIQSGGYLNPGFWPSDGWDWVKSENIAAPLYWNKQDGDWFEFTLYGNNPLDINAPVTHVSYYEAYAFAQWKKIRLPTEEEMEISGMVSPVWCWTSSHYSPYPGFRPFEGNLGEYNGKFMCNQFVLRGGCEFTPKGHYRNTYRNFYRPNQRWMFSGIRLARDL